MPPIESFGSIPWALASVALLLAASAGLGALLAPSTSTLCRERCCALLLQTVVGLNLVGLLGVSLGVPGLLSGSRSIGLLMALSLLTIPEIRRLWLHYQTEADKRRPCRANRRARHLWLFAIALVIGLLTLAPALCPPAGWDELTYHGVLPKRWQASGWPAVYLDLPYSAFPAMGEILFWLAAPMENVVAPRLLTWTCWIIGLVFVYQLLRRSLGVVSAAILTLVFPLNDTMLLIVENGYVETVVMMNVAACLVAIRSARFTHKNGNWRSPVVVGVLAGGTAAVKLTGSAALVLPCIWYLAAISRNRSQRFAIVRELATCLLTAFAVALPFYLRPWLATGNPFYPYLCQWFTTDPVTLEMSRHHHLIGGFGFGLKTLIGFIDGPLLLAFRSDNYDGRFGWQLLGFVGLAIGALASVRRRRLRCVVLWPTAVATWFYVFWFATAQQARFAVPAVLTFLLLAGLGLQQLRGNCRRIVLVSLAAAAMASVPWTRTGYYWYSALTVVGKTNRIDYVHNMTDRTYLPLIQAIDVMTPEEASLMFLYEHRSFYIPRPCVIGTPLFQEGPFSPPEEYDEPNHVMDVLRHRRITHLVVTKISIGPDQTDEWFDRQAPFVACIDECLRQGSLRTLWESEIHLLLEVQSQPNGVDSPQTHGIP